MAMVKDVARLVEGASDRDEIAARLLGTGLGVFVQPELLHGTYIPADDIPDILVVGGNVAVVAVGAHWLVYDVHNPKSRTRVLGRKPADVPTEDARVDHPGPG